MHHKDNKKRKKILKISLIIFIALIVLIGGFFAFRYYQGTRDTRVFSNGIQYGYAQAIVQIMNLSLSCDPVPLYAGNATIEVVNVACLS